MAYNGPRTPRKEKVWATKNFTEDGGWNVDGGPKINPLLDEWKTDVGLTETSKITVMRVVGRLYLGAIGAASTAASDSVSFGITWVPADVANQASADTAIPVPNEEGMRRARWYHQFTLQGKEHTSTGDVGLPLDPVEASSYDMDVRNQQKQQSVGDQFVMIVKEELGNFESATVGLFGTVSILIALP